MKRSIARLRLLLALLAIAIASVALLQGMQSLTVSSSRDLVTATLQAAPPRDAAVRVETGIGDASSRQAMTAFLEERLAGLPLTIHESAAAGAVASDVGPLVVESDPQLEEFATLTAGDWPRGADEGVLQARAAAASGLGVGDTVTFDGSIALRIVGLWEPVDATGPHWFGQPASASGNDNGNNGPLMVDPATLSALPAQATARWTIVAATLSPSTLARVATAVATLETEIDRSGLAERSLSVDGSLGSTIAVIRSSIDASDRLAIVPTALLIATSLVTLVRIAGLLWTVRRPETTLLRARGTSTRRLVGTALLEAAPIAVIGAVAGSLIPGSSPVVGLTAGAVVLIALMTAAVLGVRGAVTTVSTRRSRAIAGGLGALALVAAGVSLWQFLLYTNVPGVNPFGSLAPALGILACAVLAVGLVSPAFRALERIVTRSPGVGPALAVRHLARDAAVHATSVLLIALSVGGTALAAGYAGSAITAQRQAEQVAHGGDVRVRLDGQPGVDDDSGYLDIAEYARLQGVESAQPALTTEARVGDSRLELVATSPARQPELPAGATAIEIATETSDPDATLAVSAWLSDPQGQSVRLRADEMGTVLVPPGEWSVRAVEVTIGGISGTAVAPVQVTSVIAGTTELLPEGRTLGLRIAAPTGRVMIGGGSASTDGDDPLAVVLTDAASERLGAPPGSTVTLTLPAIGATVDAVVSATVAAVAGADAGGTEGSFAAHVDLAALDDFLLRTGQRVPQPNEVWISTPLPDAVSAEVALLPRVPAAITERSPGTGIAGPTSAVFLLGSLGAAVIAVVGVAAVAGSLGRERGADRTVLRALGLGDRAAAGIRFIEFSLATVAAAALGVVAGLGAIVLYVPTLARTAALSVDPAVLGTGLLAVACCLLVGALAGRGSR